MHKVILSVAPVSPSQTLIDPQAIAEDVLECSRLGAAMVHLHARDLHGKLTPDLTVLQQTVELIRKKSDIIIEVSTGGVSNLTIEERCQPCFAPYVEANSLNVGSVNLGEAVYLNPIRDVRYCVEKIQENHKHPDTEVFEMGMLSTLKDLDEQFHLPRPLMITLVHGFQGAVPATEAALKHMIAAAEETFPGDEYLWGFTQANRQDWAMMETAIRLGTSLIRVGFEDSRCLAPGQDAQNNAELIARVAELVRRNGGKTMTAAEARAALRFSPTAE